MEREGARYREGSEAEGWRERESTMLLFLPLRLCVCVCCVCPLAAHRGISGIELHAEVGQVSLCHWGALPAPHTHTEYKTLGTLSLLFP